MMGFYVTDQNIVVLVLFLLGMLLGLLRDIIKVKRLFLKVGILGAFWEDFFYCVVCAFLFRLAVFITNYGYVRWFEFASTCIGFFLYRLLFESFVMRALEAIMSLAVKLISRCISVVTFPFVSVFRWIKRGLLILGDVIYRRRLEMYSQSEMRHMLSRAKNGFY